MKREIIITTSRIGFHKWPEAPMKVSFLRLLHRHVFYIKVGMEVSHNDRDREFFLEQEALGQVLCKFNFEDAGSCEMIAEQILISMPHATWAEVWEDNENGARLTR